MPVAFTCPHCGAATNVADQYVGQTGPCARCGKTITIPRPDAPAMERPVQGSSRKRLPALVLVLAAVGVVALVCGGIMLGLLLPALQVAREAARRAACASNLKQISLALTNYHAANKCFPPAYIADKDGKPMHSWRVLILPYLDANGVYERYRFDEPWDGPNNRQLAELIPAVYACPSGALSPGKTDYLAVLGPGFVFEGTNAKRMGDFPRGLSNTIMVVEAAGSSVNWMEPRDLTTADLRSFAVGNLRRNHPGGANTVNADGSVHFLAEPVELEILKSAPPPAESSDVPGVIPEY